MVKRTLFGNEAIAMKAKRNLFLRAACHPIGVVACAVAVLLMASSAQAQNLFVGNFVNYPPNIDTITEFTLSGAQSTFASGLTCPTKLAIDNAGNLFESDEGSGNIYEFTPGGVQSTFASGFFAPLGFTFDGTGGVYVASSDGNIYRLTSGGVQSTFASDVGPTYADMAVNSAGDLFVANSFGYIYEFTPGGVQSTFASGLNDPVGLAFQPVPEPSALGLLAVGMFGITLLRRHRS